MINVLLILSVISNFIFFILLVVSCYYLIKFVRIIMNIEDALSDALQVFERTAKSTTDVLQMEMYFESPEVKRSIQILLDDVKLSNVELLRVIKNFTNLSKEKYITVINDDYEKEN